MTKINIEDYKGLGLDDFYYGLISFVGHYVNSNFNPMEVLSLDDNLQSDYSLALDTMKLSLKQFLDYLKDNKEIYIPSLERNVNIDNISKEELIELENICKQYMFTNLNYVFANKYESKDNKVK